MGLSREFYFKASRLGGMIITVEDSCVTVRTERTVEGHEYRRRIEFADMKLATVHERHGRKSLSESIDLQPLTGKSAFFGLTTRVDGGNTSALKTYREAAAAVLQAYAAVDPDARVRFGTTASSTAISLIILGALASIVTGLYLWQTWPPTAASYLVLLAIAVYFVSAARRVGIGKKPLFMTARDAAARAAQIASAEAVS